MNKPKLVIEEGKFYVKKSDINYSHPWIRLAKSIDSRGMVSWSMYCKPRQGSETNGNLGTGLCHVSSLETWAGREATEEEIAELPIERVDQENEDRYYNFGLSMIQAASTEMLVVELMRRGYVVNKID